MHLTTLLKVSLERASIFLDFLKDGLGNQMQLTYDMDFRLHKIIKHQLECNAISQGGLQNFLLHLFLLCKHASPI